MNKRSVAANAALALAGDLASKIGALVVVMIAARLLSVSEFAVFATGIACASLLASGLDLGAGTLLTRDGAKSEASRGALFRAVLQARAPFAAALFLAAPLVGLALGRPFTALAVAALAFAGAFALSVLGLYRSCQDIRPEALQRLASAILGSASVALCSLFLPRADMLLAVLAAITLVAVLPLVARASTIADFRPQVRPLTALRRAVPIGLLALATVAYYRSGTLFLAALSDARETAAFSVASSVAFGLLMLPNAVTTALLPRLSTEADLRDVIVCARRSLAWTIALAASLAITAAAVGPVALPFVLGPDYARAGVPFALLCVGIPLIAASGVIGTALLSVGRLRVLAVQVACTLAVNLLALAVLVPPLGAAGASLATVACEAVGLVLLAYSTRRALPGLVSLRPPSFGKRIEAASDAAAR